MLGFFLEWVLIGYQLAAFYKRLPTGYQNGFRKGNRESAFANSLFLLVPPVGFELTTP